MEQELILTPEELYYLGGELKAKYIDYAYVAAMGDIQKNYSLYESEVRKSLEKKGILEEDFSGNIEITKEVKELLNPIFFGNFESSIDECIIEDENVNSIKFHYLSGKYIGVEIENKTLKIREYADKEIIERFEKLLYEGENEENIENRVFRQDVIKKIIVIKNMIIGQESNVKILFQDDKYMYEENDSEEIIMKSDKDVLEDVLQILLEGK